MKGGCPILAQSGRPDALNLQESRSAMAPKHSDYVLGHNDREQLRLIRQARILAPFTDSFLRAAGIVSGMRVLDIGCGMGDVTMLAAQLVGP